MKEVLWPLKILDIDNQIALIHKIPINIFIEILSKIFSTICIFLFIKGLKLRYEVKV